MTTLDRERVVARLKQLPALPSAITELLASFGNEEVDVGSIARKIALDQGLTARVLRVANSSFYGLQHKVGTINEAVVVLGFRAVRSMVLAIGINGLFRVDHCPGFDTRSYLRHGVAVGVTSRLLAPLTGHNPELAFTGGLLHDIGALVLAANFPESYAAVLAHRKQHDCFLVTAERAILGMDHGEVGGLLADTWRFPLALRQALAEHHAPRSVESGSLAELIHIADAVAHALGHSGADSELVMPVDGAAWRRLGLDAEKIRRILPLVVAGVEEADQALSV
ncbi:MAG: HDOD domain-containing protein [Dechloromonas sp.]|nr:HDOD domain-containing protein [Dechloromonas sp.]